VSTNVLDFQSTSIYELHEAVCAEAAALGTAVVSTELVGLLPRAALEQGDVESLRLEDFDETKIIETHLGKL
jgi:glutamate formiminotransferase